MSSVLRNLAQVVVESGDCAYKKAFGDKFRQSQEFRYLLNRCTSESYYNPADGETYSVRRTEEEQVQFIVQTLSKAHVSLVLLVGEFVEKFQLVTGTKINICRR